MLRRLRSALDPIFVPALALLFALGLWTPQPAGATPMHTAPTAGGAFDSTLTIGFEFTVGPDPVEITALGIQTSGIGNSPTRGVGLWELDGTPLATVLVEQANDPTSDGYTWGALGSPVLLQANTTYVIAARTDNTTYSFELLTNNLLDPAFSLGAGRWATGSFANDPNPAFAANSDATYWWPHANAQFSVVPEPSTALLLALGLAGISAHRRRR